jgi:hypothetical protein
MSMFIELNGGSWIAPVPDVDDAEQMMLAHAEGSVSEADLSRMAVDPGRVRVVSRHRVRHGKQRIRADLGHQRLHDQSTLLGAWQVAAWSYRRRFLTEVDRVTLRDYVHADMIQGRVLG